MDDLTLKELARLRAAEDPRDDPLVRRERSASYERTLAQQQRELKEKVNGRGAPRDLLDDRLAGARDTAEQQLWTGPYKDTGIQRVELAQITNIPERGQLEFSRTGEAEMIAGFHKLEAIEQQPPAERLRFCQQQDAALQLAGRDSYQHVYGCFYGHDSSSCIKLVRTPDGYQIDAGRHRAYVARELGWANVPARVWVPDQTPKEDDV
jgi:hypothetical protein